MKLTISFGNLEKLCKAMGAPEVNWSPEKNMLSPLTISDIDIKLKSGLEISLEDVEVTADGLLTVQGRPVILYIMDTRKTKYVLENQVEAAPRFHICECPTLDRMREINRFERYVVTNDVSGVFNVIYNDYQTGDTGKITSKLRVCKNCLQKLNYKQYRTVFSTQQKKIWESFSIEDFFAKYHPSFKQLPSYHVDNAPSFKYPGNWEEISRKYRESVNWTCEKCGVNLSAPRNHSLLHVHHKNGVKNDNKSSNLQALCALCHSQAPQHQHMGVKIEDISKILRLRHIQRLW